MIAKKNQPDLYSINFTTPAFLLESKGGDGVDRLLKAVTDDAQLDEAGKPLVCAQCGHIITRQDKNIEILGSHIHLVANPASIEFEIGCFSQASGCRHSGTATEEWTWFPGYSWRYAICANCQEHLGWQYLGVEGSSFYGLILARLILVGDVH